MLPVSVAAQVQVGSILTDQSQKLLWSQKQMDGTLKIGIGANLQSVEKRYGFWGGLQRKIILKLLLVKSL